MKLKRFKRYVGHYKVYGPKKRTEIESRPERIDRSVDAKAAVLHAVSRYHAAEPHPYHPHVQEETENNEEI